MVIPGPLHYASCFINTCTSLGSLIREGSYIQHTRKLGSQLITDMFWLAWTIFEIVANNDWEIVANTIERFLSNLDFWFLFFERKGRPGQHWAWQSIWHWWVELSRGCSFNWGPGSSPVPSALLKLEFIICYSFLNGSYLLLNRVAVCVNHHAHEPSPQSKPGLPI